ncbi:MAG TPA: hypothetical protein VNT79_10090 [Phycisphaerae bacterium]|nr:hypothetical protein [Phycisphaerae bacterium]
MDEKYKITILYDATEDDERLKAEAEKRPYVQAPLQVAEALEKRGHTVKSVGVRKKIKILTDVIEKDDSDVIFNLCEDIANKSQHEHNVAGMLELYEKCFTGTGSAGYMLASDKALCKKVLQFHGIAYPRFCTFEKGRVDWSDKLEFPLIVKPLHEDASIGIDKGSVVHNVKELLERISYLHENFDGAALVEEFIDGREIYVGVIGNDKPEALPILEWDFSKVTDGPKIAGSEAKWDRDSEAFKAPEVFPEDIPAEVVKGIQNAAVTAYEALKVQGYGRVDMRLRKSGGSATAKNSPETKAPDAVKPPAEGKNADAARQAAEAKDSEWDYHVIEVNPNCWLEKRSEFAMAARKHGLSYPDLLERIIRLALARRTPREAK